MSKGDRFWRTESKKDALRQAEAGGLVADNMEVRTNLMKRVHVGEITLEQAQSELKRIKRGAKSAGLMTRSEAFRRG
jgi:hypothetical protein